MSAVWLALVAALLAGCEKRPSTTEAPSAQASSTPPPSDDPPAALGVDGVTLPRRLALTKPDDDPHVRPHAETLRAHFGVPVPPLDAMFAPGIDGRVIMLLTARADAPRQLLLVADRRRELLWQKERPLAGTRRGGRYTSVSGGPDGDVLVTWCDEGTGALAARRWEASGGLISDFQLLPSAGCDSLSSLHVPGAGWIVVASLLGVGRAQLLGENGALKWGREGLAVGTGFRTSTPHTIVPDTARSLWILGYGYAELGTGDRVVAVRASLDGRAVSRVELGEAPKGAAMPTLDAEQVEPGVVRVKWPSQRVDLTSDGRVLVP